MKHVRLLYLLLTLSIFSIGKSDAQSFSAHLAGRGEVPPILTPASGQIDAELKGDTLVVSGWFSDLQDELATNIAGGAHIHIGYAGRNGGVIFPLHVEADASLLGGQFPADSNRFVLDADQMKALWERALYINVHSLAHAGGELRGQLLPADNTVFATTMFGSYESNFVMSRGTGALVLDLNEDTLTVSGTVNNLSSPVNVNIMGGMHLHSAYAGQNGGIEIPINLDLDTTGLNGIVSPEKNTFTLNADQKSALIARRMYANVHTMNFGPGELRGQVTSVASAVFRAYLSGMNEVPFVPTRAFGMVIAEFQDSSLIVSGSVDGIPSGIATQVAGGAHIHMGVAGRNGGIQFPLELTLNGDSTGAVIAVDTFKMNADQFDALMRRGLYVNIHSNDVTSGELRGQLLPETQMVMNVNLSSVQSFPAVRSTAIGLMKAEVSGNVLTLTGSFSGFSTDVDTSIAGGAHIHMGPAGSTGPVIFPLNLEFDGSLTEGVLGVNQFELDEDQMRALMGRGLYVNIHTKRVASGEIRSQLLPEASTYFIASLKGSNEPTPIQSRAIGQLALEVHRGGTTIASGSFRDLEGDLATNIAGGVHIHAGFAGMNGPVVIPITADTLNDKRNGLFPASKNVFNLSTGFLDTVYAFGNYVNLHSTLHPGGELRGQLLPIANAHFAAVLSSENEVQPIANTGAHGAVSAILSGNQLRVTGGFADLEGDFASNVAGGSHIHGGYAGMNAGIAVPLSTVVDAGLKFGSFRSDTSYTLDQAMMARLIAGGMYVNVHTTTHTSGELRGQILSSTNSFPRPTSEITTPAPSSTVTVSSTSQETLLVEWTPSEDSDKDSLAYIVQISPEESFALVPIQFNTGSQRSFAGVSLASVDTLLAGLGIPIGFPVTVYARVIASDGSVQSAGATYAFNLVREMSSAVESLPDGWSFDVYPTMTSDQFTVDLQAPGAGDRFAVRMTSVGGQSTSPQMMERTGTETYRSAIQVDELLSGMWIVSVVEDGRVVAQQKILVVK